MKNKLFMLLVIILIIALAIFIILKNDTLNKKAIKMVKNYIESNNLVVNDYRFVELSELSDTSNFSKCQNGSGILVINNDGNYQYEDYLMCDNYSSKNNVNLFNSEVIVLNDDEEFIDIDTDENNMFIKKYNNIDIVRYLNTSDDSLKKIIIHTKNKNYNLDGSLNDAYPTINLIPGSDIVYYGSEYIDSGYNAYDRTDGNITNKVKVLGSVDCMKTGTYTIKYYVFNSKGNYSFKKREVVVKSNEVNYQVDIQYDNVNYTKEVMLNINITGNGYKSIKLPDGNITTLKNIEYKVQKNGKYTFEIVDMNDLVETRSIEINNIDDIVPSGTCEADITSRYVKIKVNASDNTEIKEYEYHIGNNVVTKTSNYIDYSGTFYKNNVPKISVKVSDKFSNSSTINCKINQRFTPSVIKDINGYDCLEGFVCYKQKDYNTTYQATGEGPGPVSRNGCLPTSMSIIAAGFGLKSSNGSLYTPPTLINEVIYSNGNVWGYSNYERVKYIADKLNLKVSNQYGTKDIDILKQELRKGNLVVFNVSGGCYSTGAHYLTIIGINDNDEIFVSDPWSKTTQSMTKACTVNAWASINEFVQKGHPTYFAIVSKK